MNSNKYQYILVLAGVATALVSVVTYLQSREKTKLQEDIARLDKQLKGLELMERMNKHTQPTI